MNGDPFTCLAAALVWKVPSFFQKIFKSIDASAQFILSPLMRRGVARRAQFRGRRITTGVPKSPNNVTSTFNTAHFFRKTSGSDMGAPNLLLAPGAIWPRYVTAQCSCHRFIPVLRKRLKPVLQEHSRDDMQDVVGHSIKFNLCYSLSALVTLFHCCYCPTNRARSDE